MCHARLLVGWNNNQYCNHAMSITFNCSLISVKTQQWAHKYGCIRRRRCRHRLSHHHRSCVCHITSIAQYPPFSYGLFQTGESSLLSTYPEFIHTRTPHTSYSFRMLSQWRKLIGNIYSSKQNSIKTITFQRNQKCIHQEHAHAFINYRYLYSLFVRFNSTFNISQIKSALTLHRA